MENDKIGQGQYFWALKSKGRNIRENSLFTAEKSIAKATSDIEETVAKIEAEEKAWFDDGQRDDRLIEMDNKKASNHEKRLYIEKLASCDSARVDDMIFKIYVFWEAANRWTDAISVCKDYMKRRNPNITYEQFAMQFPALWE